jgi:hypothetical protein
MAKMGCEIDVDPNRMDSRVTIELSDSPIAMIDAIGLALSWAHCFKETKSDLQGNDGTAHG